MLTVLGVAAHPTRELIATGGTDKDLRSIRIWEHVRDDSAMPPAPRGALPAAPNAPVPSAVPPAAPPQPLI